MAEVMSLRSTIMNEKRLIIVARTLSLLFTPFYLPLVGILAMFIFTYLSILPWQYKLQVVALTYLFTILLPTVSIHFYHRYNGWTLWHLREREKRIVPYFISIVSYLACYMLMKWMRLPHFMATIIIAALFVQIVCVMINLRLKVSAHMAAIGGLTGGVVAFSFILGFNPVWWLSVLILLGGFVGTSRMIMRVHTLGEITAGYIIGIITTFVVALLI